MPCTAAARCLWAACRWGRQKRLHQSTAFLRTARRGPHDGRATGRHLWGGPGTRCSRRASQLESSSPLHLHRPLQQDSPQQTTAGASARATHLVPRPWRVLEQPPPQAACRPLLPLAIARQNGPPARAQRAAPPHHPQRNPRHRAGAQLGGAFGRRARASGCAQHARRTSAETKTPSMPHSQRACASRAPPPRQHATHVRHWLSGTLAHSAQAPETA